MHVFAGVQEAASSDCDVTDLMPVKGKVELQFDSLQRRETHFSLYLTRIFARKVRLLELVSLV